MPRLPTFLSWFRLRAVLVCAALTPLATVTNGAEPTSRELYDSRVKPLLAEKCIACHGPLDQQADLRLDAGHRIHAGVDGRAVISPDDPDRSELLARVRHADPDTRMPPPGEGTPLTDEELELLTRWIATGAEFPDDEPFLADPSEHWAFQPLVAPPIPSIENGDSFPGTQAANPIDAFLADQRSLRGTKPLRRTDPETLLRRWSLGLTGLPPDPALQAAFLTAIDQPGISNSSRAVPDPIAVRRAVDTLLAGPEYPQRWARHWMDVWRYSDWDGYKQELRGSQRHIWRWRDWILDSLAEDKPYDRMVVEMLAADEAFPLDESALRATGFLARNFHRSNRNIWLDATVEHTAKAFLGLTIDCAKCHDHKYDPISQEDYYRFRAIFEPHQVRTDLVAGELDLLRDGLPRAYDATADAKTLFLIAGDEKRPDESRVIQPAVPTILGDGLQITPIDLPTLATLPGLRDSIVQTRIAAAEAAVAQAETAATKAAESGDDAAKRLADLRLSVARAQVTSLRVRSQADQAKHLSDDAAESSRLAIEAARREREQKLGEAGLAVAEKRAAVRAAESTPETPAAAGDSPEATQAAATARAARDKKITDTQAALADAETKLQAAVEAILATDDSQPKYTATSESFPAVSTGRRLALARWIVDPQNPLTARVAVNQVWMRHFGRPLVDNVFDFGLRSPPPANQALLDWLAVRWIESGWQFKPLHRLIVTSQAYALASAADPASESQLESDNLRLDPDNETYWRFEPRRLEAEAIRDSLLAVADQLDRQIGGPELEHEQGETLLRRSLYFRHAYEKQMTMLTTFDAASPNECYRRDASIIPQQALVLANSPLVRTLSQALADQLWEQAHQPASSVGDSALRMPGSRPVDAEGDHTLGNDASSRFIAAAFQRVLGRGPTQAERVACRRFLDDPAPFTPSDATGSARASLVHVLINHNDFVTVR